MSNRTDALEQMLTTALGPTYIPDAVIDGTVRAILAAWDFCGNGDIAAREYLADEHKELTLDQRRKAARIANFRAVKVWDDYRKQAGVNPT